MSTPASELVVRQHERRSCRVPCSLSVEADTGTRRVVLSRHVGDGRGATPAFVVDASRGGVGVESAIFLPRGSTVIVNVARETVAGGDNGGPPIELHARVQRTQMISRTPTYYLGLAYAPTTNAEMVAAVLDLAARPRGTGKADAPGTEEA